ncbi:Protein of unknown function [Escherichia coli]|nr:Protein of unknown function [Escherichia coli]CDU38106.1 Protein of unknown function [Escherichia coli]
MHVYDVTSVTHSR